MLDYQFGLELEVSGGADAVLALLYDGGNVSSDYFHSYHCSCPDCYHFRTGPDWTAQEDCTADGEFISRVLTTGPEGDDALDAIASALVRGRSEHSDRVGMHVHTDAGPFVDDLAALIRLWRLWLTYEDDVASLARGAASRVRSYNAPCGVRGVLGYGFRDDPLSFFDADHDAAAEMLDEFVRYGDRSGRWLSGGTEQGTFEFRIWNSTRSHWRIRMGVYVSVAMTVAALDGYGARPDDGKSLLDAIGGYLPDDVVMGIVKQLAL